ncbi:aldose epimerase [Siphonobacter sp. SORGH_AS_0500]|uniref:aldose 1-epimerase family protein n=1 Tax=Siphonobacter sp. SORGH_AS_0500 TaxID=1864824 RepID=UPI000CA84624|nr:aldose 1-epimerase family protein [Siphonobacter sp. SORGH_AS_0500]PKK35897.1 aldose epimerase [Siphonobacter sp. SORGH_AS_0500]PKK35940.1 aldose epimerase [Siphonobacter sp. SORGH_AS_0500]
MTYFLENDYLKVAIRQKGAELVSLYHKETHLEYLWSGDPAFWAKHSPILFPIVGALKNNEYHYEGNSYKLSRHGFARDMEFELEAEGESDLTFLLKSNAETMAVYPFEFRLRVIYTLRQNELSVQYKVTNHDSKDLFFSVGGHPAFRVPFTDETQYTDYYLEFNETEDFHRWPLAEGGLIDVTPEPVVENSNRIALSHELFAEDALVFKHLKSTSVTLKSDQVPYQLKFDFEDFPYLGIWAAPKAPFVCIEPWCGIADSVTHDQNLETKEGINRLAAGEVFERTWKVTLS